MKFAHWSIVTLVLCELAVGTLAAKNRAWQTGHWRDSQIQVSDGGAISIPIGGTPPSTVAGVTMPGTAPMYFSFPMTGTVQIVTVEGADGLLYVASRPITRAWPVIVNDPITFAIEWDRLYTQGNGADPKKEFWFQIVKRIRQ